MVLLNEHKIPGFSPSANCGNGYPLYDIICIGPHEHWVRVRTPGHLARLERGNKCFGTTCIEFRRDGFPPLQDSGAARAVTAKYNPGTEVGIRIGRGAGFSGL